MKNSARKYLIAVKFKIKDIEMWYFEQVTKRVNAIKFALKNKDNYCPWDVYSSSVELLFSQFLYYYETHREDFSKIRLYQFQEELEQQKQRKADNETILYLKKQLEKDRKAFKEINSIYNYIKDSRGKNYEKVDEIIHEMFPRDRYLDLRRCFSQAKAFDVRWKFDSDNLAQVSYKEVEKYNLSLSNFEDAVVDKDTEIAKRILDLRRYLSD
jgi:hypothetical protein